MLGRRGAIGVNGSPYAHNSVAVEDTFTTPSTGSLSSRTTEVGSKAWAQSVAIWSVSGGKAVSSTGGFSGWAYFNCGVSTNARYRIVLGSAMSDTLYFIFLGSSTVYQRSCIGVYISTTGIMVTSLDGSGNQTTLLNKTGLATAVAGDVLDFEYVSGSGTLYKNGVNLGTFGTNGQSGNYVGIGTNANAVISIDSVEVYT